MFIRIISQPTGAPERKERGAKPYLLLCTDGSLGPSQEEYSFATYKLHLIVVHFGGR